MMPLMEADALSRSSDRSRHDAADEAPGCCDKAALSPDEIPSCCNSKRKAALSFFVVGVLVGVGLGFFFVS